jgi:cell division protein FtsI/penicillin-binding protein 2
MSKPNPHAESIRRDRKVCVRICVLGGALFVLFSCLGLRLVSLQYERHQELLAEAARKTQRTVVLPAGRGAILDRSGEYLAYEEATIELRTNRFHLDDVKVASPLLAALRGVKQNLLERDMPPERIVEEYRRHIASALAEPLEMTEAELLEVLKSRRAEEVLERDLPPERVEFFRDYLASNKIRGVDLQPGSERRQAIPDRLTVTLGALHPERQVYWGVEGMCDTLLRGEPGKRFIEKDGRGNEQTHFRGETIPPKRGSDVFLTLDMNLQDQVEEILEDAFNELRPTSVAAILIEPQTGSILAMGCRPHIGGEGAQNWRNIPVTDAVEPGSVMKVVAIAGALDAGLVQPGTGIDCGFGKFDSAELGPKGTIHDDSKILGTQTVGGVLAHSSNIGTYKIARMLGMRRFEQTLRKFGFGEPSGLGLCAEKVEYWRPRELWKPVDFSRMSYGYAVEASMLQIAMAYGALANGGVLMKPRLIDRVRTPEGVIEQRPPQALRQACTARTAAQMREMLETAVVKGTGKLAAIDGVRVGGKTGSRRFYDDKTKRYLETKYLVAFAGMAPMENPRVVCVVMADSPTAMGASAARGGKVAAPLFATLVKAALEHLDVRAEPTGGLAQTANSSATLRQ